MTRKELEFKLDTTIHSVQDINLDWYWIKDCDIGLFNSYVDNMRGLDYMDAPELFEGFFSDFSDYKCGSYYENKPKAFKNI